MDELVELRRELEETQSKLHQLEELQSIFRIWVRLRQKLFPSNCSAVDIRGIDLVILDTDVAGCVSTFLTERHLEPKSMDALYYCDECLNIVILELQGYEGWYYRQLKALTLAIMKYQEKYS